LNVDLRKNLSNRWRSEIPPPNLFANTKKSCSAISSGYRFLLHELSNQPENIPDLLANECWILRTAMSIDRSTPSEIFGLLARGWLLMLIFILLARFAFPQVLIKSFRSIGGLLNFS
jgi:hypothetical protein